MINKVLNNFIFPPGNTTVKKIDEIAVQLINVMTDSNKFYFQEDVLKGIG